MRHTNVREQFLRPCLVLVLFLCLRPLAVPQRKFLLPFLRSDGFKRNAVRNQHTSQHSVIATEVKHACDTLARHCVNLLDAGKSKSKRPRQLLK